MKHKVEVAGKNIDRRRGVDHIGVSVASIIHDGSGKILLMKRGPKARDENGRWDVCGGAIEFGESIEDAIVREVTEELVAQPLDIEFLNIYDAHRQHGDTKTHWVTLVHAVKVDPTKVKIGEPHKIVEIGWFTTKNLPTPLHSQMDKTLKQAKEVGIIK